MTAFIAYSATVHVLCPACRKLNRLPEGRLDEHPQCGHCHRRPFCGNPIEVDEAAFQAHLRQDELPLLVDMWAP